MKPFALATALFISYGGLLSGEPTLPPTDSKTKIDLEETDISGTHRTPDISTLQAKEVETSYNFLKIPKNFREKIKKSVTIIDP